MSSLADLPETIWVSASPGRLPLDPLLLYVWGPGAKPCPKDFFRLQPGVERSENPGAALPMERPIPDFAALNPGYILL
jgi:hypothetical protein